MDIIVFTLKTVKNRNYRDSPKVGLGLTSEQIDKKRCTR